MRSHFHACSSHWINHAVGNQRAIWTEGEASKSTFVAVTSRRRRVDATIGVGGEDRTKRFEECLSLQRKQAIVVFFGKLQWGTVRDRREPPKQPGKGPGAPRQTHVSNDVMAVVGKDAKIPNRTGTNNDRRTLRRDELAVLADASSRSNTSYF